jgi:hypothetical protein
MEASLASSLMSKTNKPTHHSFSQRIDDVRSPSNGEKFNRSRIRKKNSLDECTYYFKLQLIVKLIAKNILENKSCKNKINISKVTGAVFWSDSVTFSINVSTYHFIIFETFKKLEKSFKFNGFMTDL